MLLSVYLNFLWIKRERQDVMKWNCPPIRKTGALAMLPNHCGNRFLFHNVMSIKSSEDLLSWEAGLVVLAQSTWTFYWFCLKAELDRWSGFLSSRPYCLLFGFPWKRSVTSRPVGRTTAALQSHPMKCLFLQQNTATGLKFRTQNEQNLVLLEASEGFYLCLIFKEAAPFYWWHVFKCITCAVPVPDPIPASSFIPVWMRFQVNHGEFLPSINNQLFVPFSSHEQIINVRHVKNQTCHRLDEGPAELDSSRRSLVPFVPLVFLWLGVFPTVESLTINEKKLNLLPSWSTAVTIETTSRLGLKSHFEPQVFSFWI